MASDTGGLGITLGGPAAVDAPTGCSSLSCLSFEDLLVTVRVFLVIGGYVPDSFLDSLRSLVVFSTDHSFAASDDSLADSVSSFHARASDPVNPTPGSSRDGDNIVLFSCNVVGVSALSLPPVVGAGGVHSDLGSEPVGLLIAPIPGFVHFPSVPSSVPLRPPVSSAAVPPPLPPVSSTFPLVG